MRHPSHPASTHYRPASTPPHLSFKQCSCGGRLLPARYADTSLRNQCADDVISYDWERPAVGAKGAHRSNTQDL